MASISKNANGRKTIQFVGTDGKRRSIRLGKVSQRTAEAVKVKVEALVGANVTGHLDAETTRWVEALDQQLANRLTAAGLIEERDTATLKIWIDRYVAQRTDVKPLTLLKYHTTSEYLVEFFGANRSLRSITPGDADEFRLAVMHRKVGRGTPNERPVSENTIRKHVAVAKVFFNAAVRKRLISSNPFADLKATIQPNPSRFYFVTRKETDQVLDQCPDAEWRLIFALSRYGGLRCPSEHLALRWGDVNWEHNRILVRSPKTEHHAGGDSRLIPLFPELVKPLQDVFELAEPGTAYVITRHCDTNVNLRTQLCRMIKRAGLKPWPRLFQNLRSTRQTELSESFPSHVVCQWIGNSEQVAVKHYLQVTDEHFSKAVQNPVQCLLDSPRKPSQPKLSRHPETQEMQAPATRRDSVNNSLLAEAGLEPARPIRVPGF